MKFWAPSVWSTMAMYAILSLLTYQAIQQWPDNPLDNGVQIKMPEWPSGWPKPSWLGGQAARDVIGPKAPREPAGSPVHRGDKEAGPREDEPAGLSDFSTLPLPGADTRAGPAPRRGGRAR